MHFLRHSRKLNNKINRLHKRCLYIEYKNNLSIFDKLLELHNSISIHHPNLQGLAIGLYKTFSDICLDIMKDIFPLNTSSIYDTRNRKIFYTRPVK